MSELTSEQLVQRIGTEIKKQLHSNSLCLHTALELLEAGESYAATLSLPVVLAVVDGGGNLIAEHRMDGAILASIELAKNKAYTALSLHLSTEEAAKEILPGNSLYGLQNTCPGKFCFFGGGIPLIVNSVYIGAVGVSGGTVEQDTAIAKSMVHWFYEHY